MRIQMQKRITPNSTIKLGCEVNNKSVQENELSNVCIGSLIIGWNPNCSEVTSISLPSAVVLSCLNQLHDFVLKLPRATIK